MNEASPGVVAVGTTDAEPERPWPKDVPRDALEEEKLATVNTDGEVTAYQISDEVAKVGLPEPMRRRRVDRPKVPKGWVLRARRLNKRSEQDWLAAADAVMDQTGFSPVDPKVFAQETANKFAMIKGYTTLQRIELAIQKCEAKLADDKLSEQLQIEWMTALRGMMVMLKEHLQELKDSAKVVADKSKTDNIRNRNLPPAMPPIVLQQNFNGGGTRVEDIKNVDSAKAIGES